MKQIPFIYSSHSHSNLHIHTLLQKMENPIEWERLPFYTAQKILQKLSYPEIMKIINIIPRLKDVYTATNELTQSKFIFDHLIDNPKKLITCQKLRQIYLNVRETFIYEGAALLMLLNIHKNIEILHIRDTTISDP